MSSIMLPITLMTAGAAALLNLWLAMRTSSVRTKAKIDIGDGGNDLLIRRMRAHANFVEYTPFILILIALIEYTTGTSLWLWVASAVFLLGRVGHALGMEGFRELYAEKDLKRRQGILLRNQTLGQGARLAGALTKDHAVSRANDAREIEFVDGQKALHAASDQTAMHTDLFSV